MAVAEKPLVETTPRKAENALARSSLLGGLFVLAGLWLVFAGLPALWDLLGVDGALNVFLSGTLLLFAEAGLIVGLFFLGWHLERTYQPPRGTRAGAFFVALGLFLILWITRGVGSSFEELDVMGMALTLGVAGVLVFLATRIFLGAGFGRWLARVEEQGWFHGTSYKGNQGVRVRRGTLLGLLILGLCGIWVQYGTGVLSAGRVASRDWVWDIPFTGNALYLPLMYRVQYTLPIVLAALVGWVAWRVVNWPAFADFLIATEAEMNKVSWTTRRRLFQDTIVVLVTVALLTTFLFLVDLLWIQALQTVRVLQVDLKAEQLKQHEKTQW